MPFKFSPAEARKLWVEALRSGEFKQCQHALQRTSPELAGHCCLGVACEVFSRTERRLVTSPAEDDKGEACVAFDGERLHLPSDVQDWLGLHSAGGSYAVGAFVGALCAKNDNGVPFSEIACLIESSPPGLFKE